MTKKPEKERLEWQIALDASEKRILEGVKESFRKMTLEMKQEIQEMVKAEVAVLQKEIGEIKEELQVSVKQMQELESKTKVMEINIKEVRDGSKKFQEHMTLTQCRATEKYLRFRGVPELATEDIFERMVEEIAGFLKEKPAEIKYHFDVIYRVKSMYAEQKNLPRDVIVQMISKNMKERILRKNYRNPMLIDGSEIRIMKELPKSVLQERKKYRKLTEKLKSKTISYRWEIPEGLSFFFKSERVIIKTSQQMVAFLFDHKGDFSEDQE